ncbi:endopeptidase [Vespertiliibacter pulmonis]|uniref:Putative lipoprotein NlpC n=1 Tax=Vespertiliibacter pulmonis TaxID=1443036 RepID=A0A3N4VRP9_9PAST|nr:NlpC/P60 family protein [Vespertiliibacter pulmonis]QLB21371.1 endopeptidase [Vespertiliibacter pulmonis]RPE85782.1 putative lipoprotein NlpC [Vespertiliibacter pulmonis]
MCINKIASSLFITAIIFSLTACSSSPSVKEDKRGHSTIYQKSHQGKIFDPIFAISSLSEQKSRWKGTRYRLGGTSRQGVDCSGFVQVTFRELFGISLPRMTIDQAREGKKIAKSELQAGDLVFFKTGRGPNGKHVGIYVKNGQFLHASTKGGVIYSSLDAPYWAKTFWQARRL